MPLRSIICILEFLKQKFRNLIIFLLFFRHSKIKEIIYWRCVQFKSLGCRARLRTNLRQNEEHMTESFDVKQKVEIVCNLHNHELIKHRRKKGDLKKLLPLKI